MIKKAIQNEVFWGLLLVNCSLVYFIDRQLFLVDLLKSVAVQAIMGFILISVFAAVFRYTKLASLTGLSAFLIFASMLVQPDEARQARCSPSDFKVAHFNVFLHNHSYTQLAKNALETEADLLSFQEVTNRWAYTLEESLKDIYPHYCISPREDSFGIAVFSKFPLENLAEPQWQGRPNISANILFGNQSIHFVTAHTASPISPSRYRKRNAHINDIATWLEQIPEPKLAIGDFNCVSWSPQIRNFKTVTGMRDSRTFYGATFPKWLNLFGIPIDYIFHSQDVSCSGFQTISTSSDHLGIMASFKIGHPSIASTQNTNK